MAQISLPDRSWLHHTDDTSLSNLTPSAAAKARLESALSTLTELIEIALKRDLTACPPEVVNTYLNLIVSIQLNEVRAMCEALWLATCQDSLRQPTGQAADA